MKQCGCGGFPQKNTLVGGGTMIKCRSCDTKTDTYKEEEAAVNAWDSIWSTRELSEGDVLGVLDEMRHCLAELHAMVKGECPSLLNEDSGGNAQLDLNIEEVLKKASAIAEEKTKEEAEKER